jgi:hypothetical protein
MATKSELKSLKARALEVSSPPEYESKVDVVVRGEKLQQPIYWQGRQWAVTSFGVEARDGTYIIKGSRVWEETSGHGWIDHMEEKDWVDLPDFVEALRIARSRWPKEAV